MSKWYRLGKAMVAVGLPLVVVGYGLMVIYEDYRPREFVKWNVETLQVVEKIKMSRVSFMQMQAEPGVMVEENVMFHTMEEPDPWYVSLAKFISQVQALACSPKEKPQEPLPVPDPNAPSTQVNDWGINKVSVPAAHKITKGKGIKTCVLDTGVSQHPDLKIAGGINFTGGSSSDYTDRQGHGSHTFGTIGALDNNFGVMGACPECEMWSVKVLGDDGSGSMDGIAQGYKWAADNGCKIASASLGGSQATQYLYEATKYARSKGVILVAAAGNNGNNQPNYPAAFDTVISVSALDSNNMLARFSTWGKVEIAAPGVNINSTWLNGSYNVISGTSMATPLVSGVLALALSQGKLLQADDLGNPSYYGVGIVNALKSVQ